MIAINSITPTLDATLADMILQDLAGNPGTSEEEVMVVAHFILTK